jgi:succinate dehydrogenase / fumarate reductase iron-sulfur subunit
MKVKLKVKRTDGETGSTGYSAYEIDAADNVTVLDALIHVREYEDATLALRCSCRSAICGSCSMRVDGRACLACRAKVVAITGGDESHEIVVEPMGNMPVIKDLVSDMESFWAKVRQVQPYLQPVGPEPEHEYLVPNEAMIDLTHTMNCIMCGACVSDCPVLEVDKSFIAPAALAKAYRFAGDPRDGHQKDRLKYLSEVPGGIWDCTRCNMCVEVCPKDVRPMDRIMQLREKAVEAGLVHNIGVRHGSTFAGTIHRSGRLDEVTQLVGSVGFWNVPRLLSELPGGLRMLRAGKMPWSHPLPWHKPIPGIKHVRRLMDSVRRERKAKKSEVS